VRKGLTQTGLKMHDNGLMPKVGKQLRRLDSKCTQADAEINMNQVWINVC